MYTSLENAKIGIAIQNIPDEELKTAVCTCMNLMQRNQFFQQLIIWAGIVFALLLTTSLFTLPQVGPSESWMWLLAFLAFWFFIEKTVLRPASEEYSEYIHKKLLAYMREEPELFFEAMEFIAHCDPLKRPHARAYIAQT